MAWVQLPKGCWNCLTMITYNLEPNSPSPSTTPVHPCQGSGPHLFVAPRDEKSPHPKSVRETPNEATQQVLTSTKLGELPTVVPPSGASASMRALKTQETPECSGNQWLTRFSTWHIRTGKKLKTQSLRILFSLWVYSHSNLLEAISLTDRNMIAILIKPFIKSKLHQQCPASRLHHSRNFLKFKNFCILPILSLNGNQVTVPYSPPLALQRRSNLQENQVTCWVL